jgi:hypothetical protein
MIIDNYSVVVPVVATSDVAGTAGHFEKTLGFKQQWIWGGRMAPISPNKLRHTPGAQGST